MSAERRTDELKAHDYLKQHGKRLLSNGYQIVPIQQGSKAPGFDGWEKSLQTVDQLNEWLTGGFKNAGVGIFTKNTPAIDIDINDEEMALKMERFVRDELGGKLMRIGKAPKRLFLFRCNEPFRKMRTTVRMDDVEPMGEKQQIEVLGEGQQFVAYHLHPDTGKPYTWPDAGLNPLDVPAAELPTITVEQIERLLEYFEQQADAAGWEIKKKARSPLKNGAVDKDNPWAEDTAPIVMADDELRKRLMLVPNPDDYDTWNQVGMALYHQFDGGEPGLSFWHEWSENASNYDRDALERHWKSFSISGKKRAPITARFILKLGQEALAATNEALSQDLRVKFATAATVKDWNDAAKLTREAEIDVLARSQLYVVAADAYNRISGAKVPMVMVKKQLAYTPPQPTGKDVPGWAKKWVYDSSDDRFFNIKAKNAVTQQGFDAMYDREAMTKKDILEGNRSPSSRAHELVLNWFKIKTVDGRRYEPGQDPIFSNEEGTFANTYADHEIPALPEKKLPRDQMNVERIKRHVAHILTDPIEQRMLVDWLSWVVQNPGEHVNYAILLQGVEGDGKSFFAEMMRAVMGVSNVTMLNAHIFESDFTDWAHGQCLACVEEVRLIKHTKYEIINRIKPFITNTTNEIHPKGKAVINVKNTTSYLLFSNHKDALPLDDDGRRYLVLFSQWQRRTDLAMFEDNNPDYYELLYRTIVESAGAIREWLLNHQQHEDFRPKGVAPSTTARKFMIKLSKPEFIQVLEEIIAEDECLFADEWLVDVTNLPEEFASRGIEFPQPKSMAAMLQRAGYEELSKVRLGDGIRVRFWSRSPERFRSDQGDGSEWDIDNKKIKQHRFERQSRFDDDEL